MSRVGDAKIKTEKAQDEEIINLAYLVAITGDYINEDDISTTLKSELEKTYGSGKVNVTKDGNTYKISITAKGEYAIDANGKVEQLPEATAILGLTAEKTTINVGETTKLIPSLEPVKSTGVTYSSSNETIAKVSNFGIVTGIEDGTVTITASVKGNSKTIEITVKKIEMAIDKLIINTSQGSALNESPKVNYRWKDGEEPIQCVVLYDKNSEYGLQIIAINPVRKVKLGTTDEKVTGNDDFEKAMNSYNRAIQTLNEYTELYMDTEDGTGIVSDARCVGSDPSNKNNESESRDYGGFSLKKTDDNWTSDMNALSTINFKGFSDTTNGQSYWVASRKVSGSYYFDINTQAATTGTMGHANLCSKLSYGNYGFDKENGLRPVFILNSDVVITGGNGSSIPYELGLLKDQM